MRNAILQIVTLVLGIIMGVKGEAYLGEEIATLYYATSIALICVSLLFMRKQEEEE